MQRHRQAGIRFDILIVHRHRGLKMNQRPLGAAHAQLVRAPTRDVRVEIIRVHVQRLLVLAGRLFVFASARIEGWRAAGAGRGIRGAARPGCRKCGRPGRCRPSACKLLRQFKLQLPAIGLHAQRLFIFPDGFLVPAQDLQQMRQARADGLLLRLDLQDRAVVLDRLFQLIVREIDRRQAVMGEKFLRPLRQRLFISKRGLAMRPQALQAKARRARQRSPRSPSACSIA